MSSFSNSKKHSVINGLWNFDSQFNFLLEDSVTLARVALISLNSTTMALVADVSWINRVIPRSVTSVANNVVSCLFDSLSIASLANENAVIGYSLLHSSDGLCKIDGGFENNVTSANLANTE